MPLNMIVGPADALSRFEGGSLALLSAGAIATAVWLLVFAWRWVASFPRLPDAAQATMDLREESPAIVNLLVNRWKVNHLAVAATLLDLAARRMLGIDLVAADKYVVRLRDAPAPGIAPYESQVLDLVRARATGGSAPLEVLDLGEADTAAAWRKRFDKSVTREAKKRGLARDRWTQTDWVLLGGGLLAVVLLFALAFAAAHIGDSPGDNKGDITLDDWLLIGGFAWFVALIPLFGMRDLRDTAAGRVACAHWLGVRQYLEDNHAFDDAPPPAVTVWERYLAYGVAVGAAHEAADALPFEAQDPESAWSRYGGQWHQVRVSYPQRFGFGEAPLTVFLRGLGGTVLWGGILFVALPIGLQAAGAAAGDLLEQALSGKADRVALGVYGGIALFFSIVTFVLLSHFVDSLIKLWRGAADLGQPIVIEGEVVKLHAGRVAVDDGKSREVKAWTPPAGAPSLGRGAAVRVTLTPRLYCVKDVHVTSLAGYADILPPEPGGARLPAAQPGVTIREVSPADVRDVTGLDLAPFDARTTHDAPMHLRTGPTAQAFRDGSGNLVGITHITAGGMMGKMMWQALSHTPGSDRERVEGVGEEAWWAKDQQLLVRSGDEFAFVTVDLPGQPSAERRRMASELAMRAFAPHDGGGAT